MVPIASIYLESSQHLVYNFAAATFSLTGQRQLYISANGICKGYAWAG